MSDTRLRRLDALFAEKVLGCKFRYDWTTSNYFYVGNDAVMKDFPEPGCGCPEGGPRHFDRHGESCEIAPYTRSLDAAWEGAGGVQFCCRKIVADYDLIYEAEVARADQPTEGDHIQFKGQAAHPAEALVLACLRAVGVKEEEIDGNDS